LEDRLFKNNQICIFKLLEYTFDNGVYLCFIIDPEKNTLALIHVRD
jgi:hypothetical protein